MPVNVIDTLKPKNGLSFPIVEAIDVFVDGFDNLADAVSHFATDVMIEAINVVLASKANAADLTALEAEVDTKADSSDLTTAAANLQAQIDNLITPVTQDAEVQNARVGVDGTSYNTLKARLDAEAGRLQKIESVNLFDKRKVFKGHLSGNYANALPWNTYRYSDYIKTTADKIYFNQCPSSVHFYLNGIYVGSYTAANMIAADDWYSTPTFNTEHDGFAFEWLTDASEQYHCDIDTLMAAESVLSEYTPYTGKTLIYGDENASRLDLDIATSNLQSSINSINNDIDDLNSDIDTINENVKYWQSPNILDVTTVKTGKRPTSTKGTYDNASWASCITPITATTGERIYFNFTPYSLYAYNAQGAMVGNSSSFTDEGNGWKSVKLSWSNVDSFAIDWNNSTGGFDEETSMIAKSKLDKYYNYGEEFPELFGERVARYDELPVDDTKRTKCTVLASTKKTVNRRISNTIEVGDQLELITTNWRSVASCDIPEGAIGIYLAGTFDKTYPKYAVTDNTDKVLKLSAADTANTDANYGYYVSIANLINPTKVYFECSSNSQSMTVFWVYDKNEFNIYSGNPKAVTFSNATSTKRIENDMPVMVREFSNDSKTETITFSETQHCRTVGVWLRLPDYNSLAVISGVRVGLYLNDTLATTDETENPQFLQMCNWVFLKARTLDFDFNKIKITVNFSDTSQTVFMEIGAYPIINHFNRPIMSIDFDHTWQQTADCGAYDDLIDNSIPFTITGHMGHYLSALKEAYQTGLLDIGSYAGETDGTTIGNTMTTAEILAALNERIDAKVSEGYDAPTSFGGGGHVIFPKLRRALEINNYKTVKGGSIGGINSVTCSDPRYIYLGSSVDMAMTLGGTYFLFAHGISSDPSSESAPSLFMSYTDFTAALNAIIANVNSNGALVLNMKQYSDFMSKHNLI